MDLWVSACPQPVGWDESMFAKTGNDLFICTAEQSGKQIKTFETDKTVKTDKRGKKI